MNYYHSGDDGDLIYGLASLKVLAGINPVHLKLTPSWQKVRTPYTLLKAEMIAPLIRVQGYVSSCEFATLAEKQADGGYQNMDGFRGQYKGESILHWQSDYLGLGNISHDPWLTVLEPKRVAEVVIHRSSRYQNSNFPWWDVPQHFRGRCVMVGSPDEHREFCSKFGDVPYYPTLDFLALAEVIAGAGLFIGNQSAPMAVALGLGQNVIQEVCTYTPNCRLHRTNAQYNTHWHEGINWDRWRFEGALNLSRGRTLISDDRLYRIAQLVRDVENVEGDMAEAGVFRGGSAKVITTINPNKTLHLFDTFAGIPEDDAIAGGHRKGDFAASYHDVKDALAGDNVILYPGVFPDTAVGFERKFAFVHLDLDTYQSTFAALEYFWHRLSPGGVIVLDDYGWVHCPGVARALSEVCRDTYVNSGTNQAWIFAPPAEPTSNE